MIEKNCLNLDSNLHSNSSSSTSENPPDLSLAPIMKPSTEFSSVKFSSSVTDCKLLPANLKSKKAMQLSDSKFSQQLTCPACDGIGLSKQKTRVSLSATATCVTCSAASAVLAVFVHPALCLISFSGAIPIYFGLKPKLKCVQCETVFQAA